jgi:O-antigen/teichoic acid export membrane protein
VDYLDSKDEPLSRTPGRLRSAVIRGAGWTMVGVVTMQVSRLAVAILLARLLTPREYGLAAMALVFTTLVLIFSDLSLGAALIQRKRITEADRSTVFWTSLVIGVLFTLAGVALAGPIAAFYGEPQVQALFVALSLTFVLTSLQVTQAALLQREMRFRALTGRRTAAVVLGGVAGVVIATLGYGPWALVGQQIVVSLVSTALLWTFSAWRPRWTFSRASLHDLGGFGLNLFGARFVNYFSRNTDNLLIGRFLGSSPLGLYSVAYNIVLMPLYRLVNPIQDVLFPAYSRLQDERERLAAAWLRINELTGAMLAPAIVGLIVVAPDFVPVVLGNQWRNAVPIIQVLALVGLIQALGSLGTRIFEALGRPATVFRITVLEFAVLLPALVVGLQWGVQGVAVAYAIVSVPLTLFFIWLTTRALGLPVSRPFEALSGVFQAALVMGIVVWFAREALVASETPAGIRLLLSTVLGAAVYVPLCMWRSSGVREEASRALAHRRVRTRPATTSES